LPYCAQAIRICLAMMRYKSDDVTSHHDVWWPKHDILAPSPKLSCCLCGEIVVTVHTPQPLSSVWAIDIH